MMEREDVAKVTVTYLDGREETWETPSGWIRARDQQVSMADKRIYRTFEVVWSEYHEPPGG